MQPDLVVLNRLYLKLMASAKSPISGETESPFFALSFE